MNRRGVGEVVATIALVMVAIAAVGIAGLSIMDFLESTSVQASPALNCLEAQTRLHPPVELIKACLNEDGEIEAVVRRGSDDYYVDRLSFVLGEESWSCSSDCGQGCLVLSPESSQKYYLSPEKEVIGKSLEIYVGSCRMNEKRVVLC